MRLGLMIPAVNTVAEGEFHDGVPPQVSVHTARLYPQGTTSEILLEMVREGVPLAARQLAEAHPNVVVFACTAAGAALGEAGERSLVDDVGRTTGAPVVSMNAAVHEALAATAATRCAVLTPYPQPVTDELAAGIEHTGIEVTVAAGMGIADPFDWASISPADIEAFAERHLEGRRFDAILLSCGNLRTAEVRERLSDRWGAPVVTSNRAALQAALAALSAGRAGA